MDNHSNKLPGGWHNTTKYGEVFITQNGSAWAIKFENNQLQQIQVNIKPSEIIGTSAIERSKQNRRNRQYTKSKVNTRQQYILMSQVASDD
jgi:hypothetical protein